jgi:hypothetical protein
MGICPVCETPTLQNFEAPDAFGFLGAEYYLQAVARSSKSTVEDLSKLFRPYLCSHCGANYLDPWLTIAGRNEVFISGHPVHNVGWRNLQQLVERNLVPSLVLSPIEIIRSASALIGPINSYVELGCPFQGLLVHMAPEESLTEWSAKQTTFTSMNRTEYNRFLLPMRIYMFLAKQSSNLARLIMRTLRVRDKVRGRWIKRRDLADNSFPEKFFVPLQSSKFWGLNCSMYGDSCVSTSRTALDAETLSYQTFVSSEVRNKFDLIGLFNVLDHQDNPIDLMRVCLAKAKAVVVLGHDLPFARQHHFGLGKTFFDNLERTVGPCDVVRLSPENSKSLLYLIISK